MTQRELDERGLIAEYLSAGEPEEDVDMHAAWKAQECGPKEMAEWIVGGWRESCANDRVLVVAITEALKVIPATVGALEAEAVVRDEGYPIGSPAPCHIVCGCQTKVPVDHNTPTAQCPTCQTVYDNRGWIQ